MKIYTLRTATKEDADFLFHVKTVAMEPVATAMSSVFDKEKEFAEFLQKFEPDKIQVIGFENQNIGRLRIVRSPESIYVGGIQIFPEFQAKGIGTAVFNDLISESKLSNVPIKLEVHNVNKKAISFYKKLRFKEVGQIENKILMEYLVSEV